jgi:hypothetical protein
VCGSEISGNLRIEDSRSVAFGGTIATGAACSSGGEGNTIRGNASVRGAYGPFFRVAANNVGRNLTVENNQAGLQAGTLQRVWDNDVAGILSCTGNAANLNVARNVARRLTGQCKQ